MRKGKIKSIIFDLDGTLLDTFLDIAISANAVLKANERPTHIESAYKNFIGDGTDKIVMNALPHTDLLDKIFVKKVIDEYYQYYLKHYADNTIVYPGILDMIIKLNSFQYTLGILSNKSDDFVKKCVNYFFPVNTFQSVLGINGEWLRKPNPEGLILTAEILDCHPSQCIYIGDSSADSLAARGANMHFIGVSWGYQSKDALTSVGTSIIANDTIELLNYINLIDRNL